MVIINSKIMNRKRSIFLLVLTMLITGTTLMARQSQKGLKSFTVYHEFDIPVQKLWKTVAVDYGNISNSHPAVYSSSYVNGSTIGELGAERKLLFNKKGTKALHERIVSWLPEQLTMDVQLLTANGFPINEEVTIAHLSFKALGPNKSAFQFDFSYATRPKFLAGLARGKFKALLEDYMIALEHYCLTGDEVNAQTGNFKAIKRAYESNDNKIKNWPLIQPINHQYPFL